MSKILGVLLVPFMMFAFEISFNKKFEREVQPDKLVTDLTINIDKQSESEISPQLNKFNDFILNNDNVEKKAGEFTIRPKYKYEKGQSFLVGYTGNLRYTIYTDSLKKMNKFIKQLFNLKSDDSLSITVSQLSWIVSEDKYAKTTEKLRLNAILWSQEYTRLLSNDTKSICKTEKININTHNYNPIYKIARTENMMMNNKVDSNIPIPKATKNIVSITPSYVLECK